MECPVCGGPLKKGRKFCSRDCYNRSRVKPEHVHIKKKLYKSRFGATEDLDAAQYLTENLCDRNARRNGLVLPQRFWETPEWKPLFHRQLQYAHSLLKEYTLEAIITALRTPRGKTVTTLSAAWFRPLIHAEQERLHRQKEAPPEPQPAETVTIEKPRDPFVPTESVASKLKGL